MSKLTYPYMNKTIYGPNGLAHITIARNVIYSRLRNSPSSTGTRNSCPIRSFYSVIVSRIITWWRWHRRCHTYTRRIICKPKSSLLSLTQSCISKAEDSLMGFHWPSRTQLILGCLKTRSSIIMANGFSRIITQVLRAQSDSWIVCDSHNWNGMSIAFFNIKIEKKIIVCGIRSTV